MGESLFLVCMFLGVGVLMALIARPMIQGKVPRNNWYGFRTPKTLSSDEIWYPANAYCGRALYVCGVIIGAGSLVLLPIANFVSRDVIGYSGLVLVCGPLAVMVVKSFLYLRTL